MDKCLLCADVISGNSCKGREIVKCKFTCVFQSKLDSVPNSLMELWYYQNPGPIIFSLKQETLKII